VPTTTPDALHYTGDQAADELLAREPLALLIGFTLDQQVTVEKAFSSPLVLKERLGGRLDAEDIAGRPPDELDEIFRRRPALHRFPGTMAERVQALCQAIVDEYGGDPGRVWSDLRDGAELERRLFALPGIGEMKVRSLIAVLGNRFGIRPPGWAEVAPKYPTLGDVDSPEALERYQAAKRAHKAALRDARGGR
jgi:uncharacterized HhH-GPD family protein